MVTLPLWFGAIVFCSVNKMTIGYSLVVLWLGLCNFVAGDMSSIPGWGTKILHATWHGQKRKEKEKNSLQKGKYMQVIYFNIFHKVLVHRIH